MTVQLGTYIHKTKKLRMVVKEITKEGVVIWDGIYDKNYETPLKTFEKLLACDFESGWKFEGAT